MKCKEHLWKPEEIWVTWGSGGFGSGLLIRHCKCGYFETSTPGTTNWIPAGNNWTWEKEEMKRLKNAFKKKSTN